MLPAIKESEISQKQIKQIIRNEYGRKVSVLIWQVKAQEGYTKYKNLNSSSIPYACWTYRNRFDLFSLKILKGCSFTIDFNLWKDYPDVKLTHWSITSLELHIFLKAVNCLPTLFIIIYLTF